MINEEKKYELIKFNDGDFCLDVNVSPEEDTVWLTKEQIALLFNRDRSVISRHINNIYSEGELDKSTSVHFLHISNDNPNNRPPELYNLDIIISVGYRVKSKRGIMFRKWANSILKQYLLNGYVIDNNRIMAYQSNILQLEANYINIENRIKKLEQTVYTDNSRIIFEGEIIEPYSFIVKLFYLAKNRIIIIDNYADKFVIDMLKEIKVNITIYSSSTYLNNIKLNGNVKIINTSVFHDRYIIIDDVTYNIGTSINSIGKKRFTISKLNDISIEVLLKNIENI